MISRNLLLCCLLFLYGTTTIAQTNSAEDTLQIEQIAFDYFLSKLDSIYISDGGKGYRFDTVKHKIYYSGETVRGGVLTPSSLNSYRKRFIISDSLDEDKPIRSIEGKRLLKCNKKFVVTERNYSIKPKDSIEDIGLWIHMRCYKNGFYYVCINIDIGVDWIINTIYIKLNKNGVPVDFLDTGGIT